MTALIIIGVILLILLLILFSPVRVWVSYEDSFHLKLYFAGIKIFSTKSDIGQEKEKTTDKGSDAKSENTAIKEGKRFFGFLKEKYGFSGAVKTVFGFIGDVLAHIKKLLRHIKFKSIILDISVSGDDAAKTAVEYGGVCAAVYPVLSVLDTCAGFSYKQINIKSDFVSENSRFRFSGSVILRVFFLLVAAIKIYSEYKKFVSKENFNERK
ncbi:MAG: hypothetical protein IKD04_06920 [Clostridia bacterium]|nr:hypothetical protein [Clostridia bacterium]